jgi:hypothetical protein
MTIFKCLRFETPPTWRTMSPYLYPPGTGWPSYTPKHWVPFTSPPMTRKSTVEIFEPASTQSIRSLLGNDSVNSFQWQRILKQQWKDYYETIFSCWVWRRLCNEDPRIILSSNHDNENVRILGKKSDIESIKGLNLAAVRYTTVQVTRLPCSRSY